MKMPKSIYRVWMRYQGVDERYAYEGYDLMIFEGLPMLKVLGQGNQHVYIPIDQIRMIEQYPADDED